MAFGLIVVACAIGGACGMQAEMMFGAGPAQEECGPARKTEIMGGLADLVGGGMSELTRGDVNALFPIADALRARRVDRLVFRCVEWTTTGGTPRRGRTVNEETYGRDQLDRLIYARLR